MSASKTTVTVSYRRRGLEPPVFVAGTFTNPAWESREMQAVTDEFGEYHFAAQVPVEPGREYQYHFRAGLQQDWFVDEHATIATDSLGQRCNILRVPVTRKTRNRVPTPLFEATEQYGNRAAADESTATVASQSMPGPPTKFRDHVTEGQERSATPIEQVAAVAAEVADTAAKLDGPSLSLKPSPLVLLPRDDVSRHGTIEEQIDTPLFAHESFGNYEFIQDQVDRNDAMESVKPSTFLPSDGGGSAGDNVDIDDPTLEKFPSDKESVLGTLRRIQSSTEDGQAVLDDGKFSAAVTSGRSSMDSSEEYDYSASPSLRMRENRTSRSSFGRPRSAVSLSCIAEEPKSPEDANSPLKHGMRNDAQTVLENESRTEGRDDDGYLTMNKAKA
ncbi:hypothetical protein E4U42_000486 [Claviceps africana]|uniref:AMP-activated protein kinase glycogen-binding domain-containing protein n=1 Tax=Claviceps africana TaxID=83212 RepID=A0A8K0J5C4_9HYPO|nr:hypothetical protein E4U42_000486 [Claviceps africana]